MEKRGKMHELSIAIPTLREDRLGILVVEPLRGGGGKPPKPLKTQCL